MKNTLQLLYILRPLFLLVAYSTILVVGLKLSYELRFDFNIPPEWNARFLENLAWVVPLKLALLLVFGQFGGLLSYFRFPDLYRVFFALASAALLLVIGWYAFDMADYPPRGVILADFLFSLIFIAGFRVFLRVYRERYLVGNGSAPKRTKRTAIIGAGDAGTQIAADLLGHPRHGLRPVVFLDDDPQKLNRHVHGISVRYKTSQLQEAKSRYGIEAIIIAMPSASTRVVGELTQKAQKLGLQAEIVPSLSQLTSGEVRASQIRPVEIEDLLGREAVGLDSEKIISMLEDEVVLVTGAGGSIGSELCRQITAHRPTRLLLVEQNEFSLFQIEQELVSNGYNSIIQPLVGNILDPARMNEIFDRFKPTVVFHAAAHKHVFLMERQPGEALKNNSLGTKRMADLAAQKGVKKFVLISTDKAINPTSVMGASKRLAELYLQKKQQEVADTQFMAVRFGNVLGSSGSVVPIFRKQILEGGPVRVTHPEVTRYFMTIPEAVGLVLQAATLGQGGEIFLLDMGEPVKIVDLARQMIELSGYRPGIDIEIEFIGLRPGEKLFEELSHETEEHAETGHPKIFKFLSESATALNLHICFEEIEAGYPSLGRSALKNRIKEFIPEYDVYLD